MSMMALNKHTSGMTLQALLKGFAETGQTQLISGVDIDSRRIQPGDLFLACHGEQSDGAHYIKDAIDAGAVAVAVEQDQFDSLETLPVVVIPVKNLRRQAGMIVERFYGYPSRSLDVVGITGTNGKTSVASFLAQTLSDYQQNEVGVIGTLGYGRMGKLEDARNTTPDPVTIHRLFSELRGNAVKSVIMEVSSHALEQGRVAGIDFSIGVFTNLSRDHLDYHGDMEGYARAKRQLFLSPDMKFAVVNCDDDYGKRLQSELEKSLPVIPYGLVDEISHEDGDVVKVQAVVCRNTLGRLELDILCPWGRGLLRTGLNGRFNAYNLLASLAVLCLLDVPFEQAMEKLSRLKNVPGRLEYFGDENTPGIFVDYAHTPDALMQALIALREQQPDNLICVFGCGGERDRGKRSLMGQVAEQYADTVVVTSDNPRGEDPNGIIEDILAGMVTPGSAQVEVDRTHAIRETILAAKNFDVILVAGKGHETYQEISGKRLPFSDRQLVRNVLEERS